MESLPIELHSQIFELACTDDGTTARSLSMVSRYVREVSQPFALQSIAVSGLCSLTGLVNKLELLPSHKRRVRKLFISDWTRKEAELKAISSSDADMDRYEVERLTITRLLGLVSPTIESLSFVISCPFNSTRLIGYLFSLNLPFLEDLLVYGFYPFPSSESNLPNLRRLHLSGNRNPHGIFQSGSLQTAMPKLEELRISGLVSAASFAEELRSAVSPTGQVERMSQFPVALPTGLKRITVSTGPSPANTRRLTSAYNQHQKMLHHLVMLDSACADATSCLRLEIRGAESQLLSYDDLRREWIGDQIV